MLSLLLSLVVTMLPVRCYQWVMHRRGNELTLSHRRWTYGLTVYLWAIFFVTDRLAQPDGAAGTALTWLPTDRWAWGLLGLNLFLMAPLGFLLPHIWRHLSGAVEVVFIGYLCTVFMALAQLPTYRVMAVGDVLMGTVGTFLGFLFWRQIGYYFFCGRVSSRTVALSRAEPFVYLGSCFFCQMALEQWLPLL